MAVIANMTCRVFSLIAWVALRWFATYGASRWPDLAFKAECHSLAAHTLMNEGLEGLPGEIRTRAERLFGVYGLLFLTMITLPAWFALMEVVLR